MSVSLVEGSREESAGRFARRAPLGRRVVATLESSRSLLGVALFDDDELLRVRDGDRDTALRLVEQTSEGVIAALSSGPSRTVRILKVQELLAELQSEWHELQQELLANQVAMMDGIRLALHRLRGIETMSQMVERATVEVCKSCGVDRCVLLSVDEGKLRPESVHFAHDPELQEEWELFARANPPIVDPRDPEIQLLRRNQPILVRDPSTSRGVREVADHAHSIGYVAAPVMVRGSVVATLHADRTVSGDGVDTLARDTLALFAEGLGYAMERTVLLGRMRSQFSKIRDMMAEANSTLEEAFDAGVSLRRDVENGQIDAVSRGPAMPFASESALMGLLTRREVEVVGLMARGASNADIANELVISEGTVKSHVKHILRKMRAANRAQAVSCYMRLQSMSAARN